MDLTESATNISIDILNYFKDEKDYIDGITRKSNTSYVLTITDYIDDMWFRCDLKLDFKVHVYIDTSMFAKDFNMPRIVWEKKKSVVYFSKSYPDIPKEFIDLIKKFLDKWEKFEYTDNRRVY